MTWYVVCAVACAAAGCETASEILPPPSESLKVVAIAGSTVDSTWGSVGRVDVRGCMIAATDFYSVELRVLVPGGTWEVLASRGAGPGELAQPRSVMILRDGSVAVLDIGKQRLIRYDAASGRPIEVNLWEGTTRLHRIVGPIVSVSPDTLLDFWMAGEWGGHSQSYQAMRDAAVVDVVDTRRNVIVRRFGKAILPPDQDDHVLMSRLQSGDIAVRGGRVYLLRAPTGVVQVYDSSSEYALVDSIVLPRYRRVPAWHEGGTRWHSGGLTDGTTEFEYQGVASAIAVVADGGIVAVVYGPDGHDADPAYPNQLLVHLSANGALLNAWALPMNGVRGVYAMPDGRVLLLGHAVGDQDGDAGSHLLMAVVPLAQGSGEQCTFGAD